MYYVQVLAVLFRLKGHTADSDPEFGAGVWHSPWLYPVAPEQLAVHKLSYVVG